MLSKKGILKVKHNEPFIIAEMRILRENKEERKDTKKRRLSTFY